MRILLAKTYERALEIIEQFGPPLISIEAVYGNKLIKGKSLTLDHHTEELYAPPGLHNGKMYGISDKEYILVSHIDLDTITGIYLCCYGSLDEPTKQAINFIDEQGMHKLPDIQNENAKALIKAYRGYTIDNPCPRDEENITNYVIKTINEIFIKTNNEYYINKFEEYERTLRSDAIKSIVKKTDKILLLNNESGLIGLNTLYDLDGHYEYIINYNSTYASITISSCTNKIALDVFMKEFFGSFAGGHSSIAGTPRGMKFTLNDANIIFNHLNLLLQN